MMYEKINPKYLYIYIRIICKVQHDKTQCTNKWDSLNGSYEKNATWMFFGMVPKSGSSTPLIILYIYIYM